MILSCGSLGGPAPTAAAPPIFSRAMESQEIIKLSTLAERLGWRRRDSTGVHVVDLLVSRTVTDLIAALAENRNS